MKEIIEWITNGDLPDDEITVLACTKTSVVGEAFHTDGHWFWSNAGSIDEQVTAWADLPKGPKTNPKKRRKAKP